MKPFGLQSVLDYRGSQEDLAKHRLNEAKKVQETVKKKLAEEQATLAHFIAESEKLQQEGIGITELIRYEERITVLQLNVAAIAKNLTAKRSQVDKERQNLIQKSMERQVLERLKETQNKAWQKYLNKKEAAMLDEIASTRHQTDGN